ncbi:MAG: ribosome silencing factor [bacterium]
MTSKTEEKGSIKKIARLSKSSKILKVIITAIQDRKGEHIVTLDLRKITEAVSDFFIVCEASSTTQVKAIADWVEVSVKKECGEIPYKHEGHSASQWILIDYVNVVVHVFHSETRKFYKLEEMWSDGVAIEEDEEVIVKVNSKKKDVESKGVSKSSTGKQSIVKKGAVKKPSVKKAVSSKASVSKSKK